MPHQTPDGLAWYLGIARSIAGQMKYDAVVQEFAVQIRKTIQYDHLDIVLLAAKGRHFHYESGMDTTWNDSNRHFKQTALSPVRQVLEGQEEYMLTEDAQLDERFNFEGADNEAILSAELRSRIVVPLKVQGAILGSLAISSQKPGCYTNCEVEVARGAADLLSPYLFALARNAEARKSAVKANEAKAREELLRVGALRLTEGMERERRRLGMDLHDQTMADLARMSRRISNLLGEPRIHAADLEVLAADLELCRQELHQIVEDLKPGLLELFGFSEAVDAYLMYWVESTGSTLSTN
jgi:signal transduction histidine kinase